MVMPAQDLSASPPGDALLLETPGDPSRRTQRRMAICLNAALDGRQMLLHQVRPVKLGTDIGAIL